MDLLLCPVLDDAPFGVIDTNFKSGNFMKVTRSLQLLKKSRPLVLPSNEFMQSNYSCGLILYAHLIHTIHENKHDTRDTNVILQSTNRKNGRLKCVMTWNITPLIIVTINIRIT